MTATWTRSDTGRRRKYYTLEPAGLEALDRGREQWMAVHSTLADANIDVYASSGVADGRGRYGYVLYLKPEHCER